MADRPGRPAGRGFLAGMAGMAGLAGLFVLLALAWAPPGHAAAAAAGGLTAAQVAALQQWVRERAAEAGPVPGARIEVELGAVDPRLRLAPCREALPYLPAASRPWGRTRVGLRCAQGPVPWNITLPVQVRVMAPAPVLREPLPAGAVLDPGQFTLGEADWAAEREPPLDDPDAVAGQRLARTLPAGAPARADDLQQRRWFAAGARVRVDAVGPGWRVSTEGRALTAGIDGRPVRVRTEGGRVISGQAVAEGRVEVRL